MNKQAQHTNITQSLLQTYTSKNRDYGNAFSETYQKLGIVSAVTRISDKTNRLISLAGKPEDERKVKDESIRDTLEDLANYAIMTIIEMDSETSVKESTEWQIKRHNQRTAINTFYAGANHND